MEWSGFLLIHTNRTCSHRFCGLHRRVGDVFFCHWRGMVSLLFFFLRHRLCWLAERRCSRGKICKVILQERFSRGGCGTVRVYLRSPDLDSSDVSFSRMRWFPTTWVSGAHRVAALSRVARRGGHCSSRPIVQECIPHKRSVRIMRMIQRRRC